MENPPRKKENAPLFLMQAFAWSTGGLTTEDGVSSVLGLQMIANPGIWTPQGSMTIDLQQEVEVLLCIPPGQTQRLIAELLLLLDSQPELT